MSLLKLPVGIQHFNTIREEDYLYVDKTKKIHQMVTTGKFYFLSRPRRFGKSLTVSTLMQLFKGRKELFEGLWIENNWDWSQQNPVVHISFSNIGYQKQGLEQAIRNKLVSIGEEHGITFNIEEISQQFRQLIEALREKYGQVVILIDEYDKPLIDYLNDLPKALANQRTMKAFYSILKDAGEHIRLLFITGVSKFSQVSIFSDLNNLEDLTLASDYADMLGYTQNELEQYFAPLIGQLQEGLEMEDREPVLDKIKFWYNGYSWNGRTKVYNPFSILRFFKQMDFFNFWFETGTPTFLIKLLKEKRFVQLDDVRVHQSFMGNYTLENMGLPGLLFQTGYLTIRKKMEGGMLQLSYPNYEVRESFLRLLVGAFRHDDAATVTPDVFNLRDAFYGNDLERVFYLLKGMFKNIPSQIFIKDAEAYYHSLVYLIFCYMGLHADAEVNTNDGRLDAVVKTPTDIYVLEFKLDKSADEALQQIRDKGYAEKYRSDGRPVHLVGVDFSSEKKEVGEWKVEVL